MISQRTSRGFGLVVTGAAILASGGALQAQASKRPLRVDDLYAEEHLTISKDWSTTPAGAVAIVVERAPNTRKAWRAKGADVWVQIARGQPLTNVTQGARDDTDWRDPIWSPDGARLLIVSTRGGTRSLWLWDRATNKLRALTDRSLGAGTADGTGGSFYEWADDGRIVASTLPQGLRPPVWGTEELPPMAAAKAGWGKFLAGESSASVLETGVTDGSTWRTAPPTASSPRNELQQMIRVDVATGITSVIVDTYRPALFGVFKPSLSPDGEFVVVAVYGGPASGGGGPMGIAGTIRLVVSRVDGKPLALDRTLPNDVFSGLPRWSPDGSRLAFFAFGDSREQPSRLVVVDVARGHVEERVLGDVVPANLRDDDWDFARLEWTETGQLVVRAGQGELALKKFARRDWWLVPASGPPRNLTAQLATVPSFERLSSAGPLVGLSDSVIWKLDAERARVDPVTDRASMPVTAIAWPPVDRAISRYAVGRSFIVDREERPSEPVLVVESIDRASRRRALSRVDVAASRVVALATPAPGAVLARLGPRSASTVAYWIDEDRRNGSVAWRTTAGSTAPSEELVSLNRWRDDVAVPRDTVIEYTSLHGERWRGWLLLPVGYQPGRRYPTIVRIYPGQLFRPDPADAYNRIAAAAGYAVLWPQMGALNGHHFNATTRDVFFDVPNGALPAVEQAITLGIADPDRLFVEGASGGGFATYAIIEQTNRFKGALAAVGISSWMNGSFSARGRYGEDVALLAIGWMNDNVQDRPPVETMWSDIGLFQRNSPIIYADRIQTPLLIVHSDQDDNVPMSQSEEMFSAMVQLKKRATFVRYWGEGHGFENPANVRDLWQRRLAWFDGFGDIARDASGRMIFDGPRVRSRGKAPPLKPADYERFELFQPGGKR